MAAIEVRGLRKVYGDVVAVDGIDLTVREGEVVALLGPNGAGKTTTVEILEGYRQRDGGSVSVLGRDPGEGGRGLRERIGIVLQEAGFEDSFTPRELIRLHAGYYPHPRPVEEVVRITGLEDKADARVRTLSGGQRRRLDLALGIVGNPDLLFLDEPTTGFDPSARRRAWDLVEGLRDLGATILLTSHYLDEAEHLADRVVVIAHGQVLAQGTPDELAAAAGAATVLSFRLPQGLVPADLPPLGRDRRVAGNLVEIRTDHPTEDVAALAGWALQRGDELEALGLRRPGLEDVYLDLVGEPAGEPVGPPTTRGTTRPTTQPSGTAS